MTTNEYAEARTHPPIGGFLGLVHTPPYIFCLFDASIYVLLVVLVFRVFRRIYQRDSFSHHNFFCAILSTIFSSSRFVPSLSFPRDSVSQIQHGYVLLYTVGVVCCSLPLSFFLSLSSINREER